MTKHRDHQIGLRGQLFKPSAHALDYHVLEQNFLSSVLVSNTKEQGIYIARNVTFRNSKKSCSYSNLNGSLT